MTTIPKMRKPDIVRELVPDWKRIVSSRGLMNSLQRKSWDAIVEDGPLHCAPGLAATLEDFSILEPSTIVGEKSGVRK